MILRNKDKKKKSLGQLILLSVLTLYAIFSLLPVLLVLIVSFSSEASLKAKGFSFFPTEYSLAGYKYVVSFGDQVIRSYGVTIFETVAGTSLSLLVISMFAYVLSRRDVMINKFFTIYLLVTMLFSGGMLSSYLINTNVFHLRNNILVLILPSAVTVSNCIIMRTFIRSNLPDSLVESAKIDGASEVSIFYRIVLPIMKPALAAIGFMIAIGHWNEWQTAYLYIDKPQFATLQLLLMRIEKDLQYLRQNMGELSIEELQMLKDAPGETARMAILFCTLGPVMIAYPFFQKYFVKGITVGAVKG